MLARPACRTYCCDEESCLTRLRLAAGSQSTFERADSSMSAQSQSPLSDDEGEERTTASPVYGMCWSLFGCLDDEPGEMACWVYGLSDRSVHAQHQDVMMHPSLVISWKSLVLHCLLHYLVLCIANVLHLSSTAMAVGYQHPSAPPLQPAHPGAPPLQPALTDWSMQAAQDGSGKLEPRPAGRLHARRLPADQGQHGGRLVGPWRCFTCQVRPGKGIHTVTCWKFLGMQAPSPALLQLHSAC